MWRRRLERPGRGGGACLEAKPKRPQPRGHYYYDSPRVVLDGGDASGAYHLRHQRPQDTDLRRTGARRRRGGGVGPYVERGLARSAGRVHLPRPRRRRNRGEEVRRSLNVTYDPPPLERAGAG